MLLLMAEFLMISLKAVDSFKILLRLVRSSATVLRHSVFEAAVKREPAYLPGALSVMAGGL
jgi:hypothetical protein